MEDINKDEELEDKKEVKKKKKKSKTDELKEEIESLNNKLLLSQADLINYRKRKDDEVSNFKKYANQDMILSILDVTDNFERAIKLDDNILDDELSKFLVGFKMIYASLMEILKSFGVEELDLLHKPFDPKVSEVLFMDSDKEFDNEVVLDVLRKGYKLHDKVIRVAQVKVNKIEKEKENK